MMAIFKSYFNKSTISVVAFKFLQIFFGFDFGYFEYKNLKTKLIAKLACLLQGSIITYLLISAAYNRIKEGGLFWYSFIVLQYTFLVFGFTLFPSKATLSQFQNELDLIDLALKSYEPDRFAWKWKILVLVLFLTYRILGLIYYFLAIEIFLNPVWLTIVYGLMSVTVDLVPCLNIFIFYSFYSRVHSLYENFSKSDTNQIISFRHTYMSIVRVTENYKRIFDLPYIQSLIENVFIIMITIYNVLSGSGVGVENQGIDIFEFKYASAKRTIEVIMALLTILAPAYCAQKLSSEVDKLKALLYDRLLTNECEVKCRKLERFIRYVEARPLKFTVYKVIPLDANLLGMVFTFCVTYLIVIIQFTHVY